MLRRVGKAWNMRPDPVRKLVQRSQRVAGDIEHVTVVGGYNNQRFAQVDHLGGGANRLVELLCVDERAVRVALMMRMVDPSAFDHQEIPLPS